MLPDAVDLQALYQDLNIVEPRLLACLDELGNSQVRELLRRLNVHELEPQQVLQQHIYPLLRSKAWEVRDASPGFVAIGDTFIQSTLNA